MVLYCQALCNDGPKGLEALIMVSDMTITPVIVVETFIQKLYFKA